MSESTLILRGEYRWTWCHAAEYIGGSPLVCTGHDGTPPAGLADPAGVAFAAAAGDGAVGGAFGPGLAGALGAGEAGGAAAGPAGEGEPVFGEGGLGLAPDGAAPGADAPPCTAGEAVGLAAPVDGAFSCSAGARAPIFETSWPIRIFPRNTGRSKM